MRRGTRTNIITPRDTELAYELSRTIPGLVFSKGSGQVSGAPDAFWAMGEELVARSIVDTNPYPDIVEPDAPYNPNVYPRDYTLYPFQDDDATWMAKQYWALNANPMGSGKTGTTLTAAMRAEAKKVLVICPALARGVWAEERQKWYGANDTLLLYGRAANKVRWWGQRRFLTDGLQVVQRKTKNRDRIEEHQDLATEALHAASWVIVNYELLIRHATADARGRKYDREDLPGWAETLRGLGFDLVIFDECHKLRGWDSKVSMAARRLTEHTPRVWGLTGTPIYGFTRDLASQLDILSGGLYFGYGKRGPTPFNFHARYCGGMMREVEGQGEFWWANGSSHEDELAGRLRFCMVQRKLADILPHLPPKTRQTIRIEQEGFEHKIGRGSRVAKRDRAMLQTAKIKVPKVIENIQGALVEGQKVMVLCKLKKTHALAVQQFDKLLAGRNGAPLRRARCKPFYATGDLSSDARFKMAQQFREHSGAALWLSTIDAIPGMISLAGATSCHFIELHDDPEACRQAENRAYGLRATGTGLRIVYYIVEESYDAYHAKMVLPKLRAIEAVLDQQDAADTSNVLTPEEEEYNFDAMMDEFLGGLNDE